MKTPAWLSQSGAPFFWEVFQFFLGSHRDKKNLYRSFARGRKTILEIGCSLGNTASAFKGLPDVHYTGLDIDPVVIRYAQKKFRSKPNFDFTCADLHAFSRSGRRYDLVLFAGMLHHVDDAASVELLKVSMSLVGEQGLLVVIDPLKNAEDQDWGSFWIRHFEKGEYVRTNSQMKELFARSGLAIRDEREATMLVTHLPLPMMHARFGVYVLAEPGSS